MMSGDLYWHRRRVATGRGETVPASARRATAASRRPGTTCPSDARAPAGIDLLPDGTWDWGSSEGSWLSSGCGCGSGGECECGGSCGGYDSETGSGAAPRRAWPSTMARHGRRARASSGSHGAAGASRGEARSIRCPRQIRGALLEGNTRARLGQSRSVRSLTAAPSQSTGSRSRCSWLIVTARTGHCDRSSSRRAAARQTAPAYRTTRFAAYGPFALTLLCSATQWPPRHLKRPPAEAPDGQLDGPAAIGLPQDERRRPLADDQPEPRFVLSPQDARLAEVGRTAASLWEKHALNPAVAAVMDWQWALAIERPHARLLALPRCPGLFGQQQREACPGA